MSESSYVCACVRKIERETIRERERDRQTDRQRQRKGEKWYVKFLKNGMVNRYVTFKKSFEIQNQICPIKIILSIYNSIYHLNNQSSIWTRFASFPLFSTTLLLFFTDNAKYSLTSICIHPCRKRELPYRPQTSKLLLWKEVLLFPTPQRSIPG